MNKLRALAGGALFALGYTVLTSCVSIPASNPAFDSLFAHKAGCFLLYDMTTKTYVDAYNPDYCSVEKPALSTFKVPLALMGFEADVLKNENTSFKWNGEKETIPAWNRDQNATTWMANSVIWYSQRITKALGKAKVQSYLEAFDFGNKDFSGNPDNAWLTPAPFIKSIPTPTLFVSPVQQIEFWEKLWTFRLPVKRTAMDSTQKILYIEESLKGFQWSGKTGSGYLDASYKRRLGWFVAHVEGRNRRYLAVLNFEDLADTSSANLGGTEAKAMMIKILASKGLY